MSSQSTDTTFKEQGAGRQDLYPATHHLLLATSTKGFSLIELIVVISVLSILMAIFLNRVAYYQELVEKTAMEQNIGAIQDALTLLQSKHYARGNADDITMLPTENPMKWLQILPQNYAGEFYDPSPKSVPPGSWVFDLKSRQLIYVLKRTDHFIPGKDNGNWIHFKIGMQYEPIKRNDVTGQDKELVGTKFAPVEQVNWF
jgi:prepilin-type N-terminal cleavage/methylation domain-containing protein